MPPRKTKYALHVEKWENCTDCELYRDRRQVVFARGSIPCDVLFIGEGPGASEDVLGAPFVGPTGYLMDEIIARAIHKGISYALYNLVGCIPRDPEDDSKTKPPPQEAIEACSGRLQEFVEIANPKLIITVGATARDNLDTKYRGAITFHNDIPMEHIEHPAAILRMNIAQQGLAIQRAVVIVRNVVEDLPGVKQ
jgi:DNA polymerase